MEYTSIWETIIKNIGNKEIELPTTPKTSRTPVWFTVTTDGTTIYINKSVNHEPSSKLKMTRKLNINTFNKVYPLYLRRETGEAVSQEATVVTVDQVYYYSVIKHL